MDTATRGRFVWHELMTNDTQAAKAFYEEVVGWGVKRFEGAPMEYDMWMAGEVPIGGLMVLPQEAARMGTPPNWLAYIEVPDIDATVSQAAELGGLVLVPPHTIPMVGRFGVIQDPQGAVFAVITNETPMPPEDDPKPREFSWHELITTDLDGAQKFYRALFGWVDKGENDMGPEMGMYKMFGCDRFTYGGMFKKSPQMPAPTHWMHYVSVDSADAAAERATKAGGQVVNGPMEVPGGDRIATIIDPQGASFAVHSK